MNAQEMWENFSRKEQIVGSYAAWAFGDDPDELAELTLQGIKTATASLALLYARENAPLPRVGEYSVVLDSHGHAVCIIRTSRVYVVPFEKVSASHAYKEGEGDRSLQYWQYVHACFFHRELAEAGMAFDRNMDVVCEEFIRVYP